MEPCSDSMVEVEVKPRGLLPRGDSCVDSRPPYAMNIPMLPCLLVLLWMEGRLLKEDCTDIDSSLSA